MTTSGPPDDAVRAATRRVAEQEAMREALELVRKIAHTKNTGPLPWWIVNRVELIMGQLEAVDDTMLACPPPPPVRQETD